MRNNAGCYSCMYFVNHAIDGFLTTCPPIFFFGIRKWRAENPFSPFDRVAFNECCAATIVALQTRLAVELATFNAKFEAWKEHGSKASLRPKGKSGNIVTRSYAKTGWWPLKKDSELWQQAISTLSPLCAPTKHKLADRKPKYAALGDKRIKIRSLVLQSFQNDFIDKAYAVEERAKQTKRRKAARISIENTYSGKGFCKREVRSNC